MSSSSSSSSDGQNPFDAAAAAAAAVSPQSVVLDSVLYASDAVVPPDVLATAFDRLQSEVAWSTMYHKGGPVPRHVALQGDVCEQDVATTMLMLDNGGNASNTTNTTTTIAPLYRHPADEQPPLTPWTPTVRLLRDCVARATGIPTINHVLIQRYAQPATDYISEHADKTLDIAKHSTVYNLSIGATRTMILRPKDRRSRQTTTTTPLQSQPDTTTTKTTNNNNKNNNNNNNNNNAIRVPLHHGSLFGLGWETNRHLTHEIRRDKRPPNLKTAAELAYGGVRISLTFRTVATFTCCIPRPLPTSSTSTSTSTSIVVFGQGAVSKTLQEALDFSTARQSPKQQQQLDVLESRPQATVETTTVAAADVSCEEEQVEAERLLQAFSIENKTVDYEWDKIYGGGFNLINFAIVNERLQEPIPPTTEQDTSESNATSQCRKRAEESCATPPNGSEK